MIVGYMNDSTTLWWIWKLGFLVVKSQSDVILDEKRNAYTSCLDGDQRGIFKLPEETEYIEEIDSGDGCLHVQDNEMDGDGLWHDHARICRIDKGHIGGDHNYTADKTDYNLPDADNYRSRPATTCVGLCPADKDDTPLVSRETVV